MWSIIAAIVSAVVGLGAGTAGLNTPPANLSTLLDTHTVKACYQPELDVSFTLNWPDNFQNVPDNRKTLNPDVFGNVDSTFDTDSSCQALAMNQLASREFIRVRQDIRMASCKTDELAGPYGIGKCPDYLGDPAVATRHRGTCALDGYTDLRKIAETDLNEERVEVFWNPFSYNVGCDYRQDVNCGPQDDMTWRSNHINLKDFVYVLKKRDAFDLNTNPSCPVLWDAGTTNAEACSHYFDVYMAKDIYDTMQAIEATEDPESPYYFLKQVVENCKEENLFIPAPEANLSMPPLFIYKPFLSQNQSGSFEKISPRSENENRNYLVYVWSKPDVILYSKINLLKIDETSGSVILCDQNPPTQGAEPTARPTSAPLPQCYDPLGVVGFTGEGGEQIIFNAYSMPTSPLTFYLVRSDNPSMIYSYTITDKTYPTNTRRDPSLQLRVMQLITGNNWTWATPWCKPAIYLYPNQTSNLNIKLNLSGKMTVSDPLYDPVEGWNIIAHPDGVIKEQKTNNLQLTTDNRQPIYPYLYYEADLNGVEIPKEGWVIQRSVISNQLSEIMSTIGFNQKEISDFLSYWLPRLTEKPYYFVTLLPEEVINEKERLEFSALTLNPKPYTLNPITPDTLIRTRFVFEGLDGPINVSPPKEIPHYQRTGFTVTDWGGTLVGESCDIKVQ